ncbi:Bromodomain-containing protein [Lepidopterella palustris CBS 459.81]|uniref:Bromodomain-containing protein n=1 Tax=Lepidopterella palustris CBS 459.81 TaxID=1314670 RepID=A0A8E2JKH0_9PEZI|nr:Bromodomain-containing protein [Lepidopterella palustris CBS 459.81]
MAVMTSPAFDKAPFEGKALPAPSTATMALDSDINGVAPNIEDLFDDPDSKPNDPSARPVRTESLPEPTLNGNHTVDDKVASSDLATAPITNISSGIASVAQFTPDHANSLFNGSEVAAPTSITSAVEAPTSDVRQDTVSILAAHEADLTKVAAPDITDEMDVSQGVSLASVANENVMDTSGDLLAVTATELPELAGNEATDISAVVESTKPQQDLNIRTQIIAQSPPHIPFTQSPTSADQEMAEAPSSGKVRSREDDDEEGAPSAKRTKTDEELEVTAQFKVPEIPTQKDQVAGNGTTDSAEQSIIQSAVSAGEWPTTPMTKAQNKFLLERVRNTKKIKVAYAFKDPVDAVALGIPQYFDIIKDRMDLSTMETKLKEDKYPSVLEFMKDLDLIINNSITFNTMDHPITQAGLNMRAYFIKGMNKMPKADTEEPHQKKPKKPTVATSTKPRRESRTSTLPAKSPTVAAVTAVSPQSTWPLNSDGTPLIRRDSSSANDRPKREIHRPPPKDLPYNSVKPKKKKYQLELKFCESVVSEMVKPKYARFAYPFLKPVDPVALNIPQYLKIIKKPMDLGTIEKNLKDGGYQSAKDFKSDVDLMFQNCYKFNPETDDVYKMGKMFQELFNSLWNEKQTWMEQHAPVSEAPSPASDDSEDDAEEEEEEEEDQSQAQIKAIQQQIAQLNETAQALLQSKAAKRPSPKAPTKKASKNAKPTTKSRKSSTLVPPPKVTTKVKARSKPPPPLTFGQKQEISDGISTLGDADMRKAVQIIRNGCPHLAHVNDDEMEIDMDEIGDDCLRELLKFIKSVRGPKAAADDDFEPQRNATKSAAATKPRKNKPMGKKEQEENIRKIQDQLKNFDTGASGSDQSPPAIQNDESSDDDEDSGSESEEE